MVKISKKDTKASTKDTKTSTKEDEKNVAKASIKIHKYSRILIIQIKGYYNIPNIGTITGVSTHFINKKVKYKRYLTINEGARNELVYNELIGVIVFEGRSLDRQHYIAYVLNLDKTWYKSGDILPNEVPTTAFEAFNQELPYICFLKSCNDKRIDNEHINMIRDSFGKDNKSYSSYIKYKSE